MKAILDEAVSKATGTTGDRLARSVREALHAAGRSAERVRLVRVFGGEDVVAGAKKIGEHQFLVDLMPHSMKQVFKDPKDEKNKSRGPEAAERKHQEQERRLARGSFSMETVAQDRKSERGAGGPEARSVRVALAARVPAATAADVRAATVLLAADAPAARPSRNATGASDARARKTPASAAHAAGCKSAPASL